MARVKQKTHKGLQKRVRVTARKKVVRKASFGGHLMSGKSGKRCRWVGRKVVMYSADAKRTIEALAAGRC